MQEFNIGDLVLWVYKYKWTEICLGVVTVCGFGGFAPTDEPYLLLVANQQKLPISFDWDSVPKEQAMSEIIDYIKITEDNKDTYKMVYPEAPWHLEDFLIKKSLEKN